MNGQIRGDWLEQLGLTTDDIVTFDDFYDVLTRFKTEIDSCNFPWAMLNVIDMSGNYTLNAFDTLPYVSPYGIGPVFAVDGRPPLPTRRKTTWS